MEQEGVGGRKCRFADEAEIVDTFSSFSSPSLSPPLPSAAGCNSIKIGRSAFLLFRARMKGRAEGGRVERGGEEWEMETEDEGRRRGIRGGGGSAGVHARDRKGRRRRRLRDGSLARAALGGGGGRLPYRLRRPRRSRKDGGKAIRLRARVRVKGEERLKIVTPDLLHGLRSTTKVTRIPVEEARDPYFLSLHFPVP